MLEELELEILHALVAQKHLLLLKKLELVHLLLRHALVVQLLCLVRQLPPSELLLHGEVL